MLNSLYWKSNFPTFFGSFGSYREDPTGPMAGLAEPVSCDDMPAVRRAAGGLGLGRGRGAAGVGCLLSFILLCRKNRGAT